MEVGTAFFKLLITGGLIIAAIASFVNENNSPVRKINITHYNLPDYIKPSHYDIKLITHIKDGYFYGESNIIIYINRTTQTIYLHSAYLTIFDVQLKNEANTIYEPSLSLDYKKQIAILNFDDILSKSPIDGIKQGTYILRMKFVGAIYENIGLFRISQNNEWIYGTHNLTRRIFPCWDDPAFKATFNISVQHEEGYVALSNMPIRDGEIGSLSTWTHFEKTPLMSTDRVGIVVTNFCKKNIRHRNHKWSRCIGQVSQFTHLASFVIKRVTNYLKKDWKSLYKVPNMNYFIVPNFPDEISQTWGLIFYRENDIIYDVLKDSSARKVEVMRSVTRGITNQLVEKLFASSSSWTNLWLNEGFNIFFGAYVLDKVIPDSHTMDLFVIETQHEALHFKTPLHKYTHFEKDYTDLKEIKYDALISLSRHTKAPILWRVLQNVIPEKMFWSAIRTYLKTYTFSNSSRSPDNLWAIMQTSLELEHNYMIKQLMDTWTIKNHYSILNVNRNYEVNSMIISCDTQEREYWIPVTYTVQSQCNFNKTWPDNHHWLTHLKPELSVRLPEIDSDNWAIVNIQQIGFYRVNYDVITWNKITEYLKSENYTKIHVLNRAKLIDDAFHLALQRKLKFSLFFGLAFYLERERHYIAWYPMFKAFEYMSCIFLFPRPFLIGIAQLMVFELEKHFLNIKSETDDRLTKRLRYEGQKWACILDSPICTERATTFLKWHLDDPKQNKVPTELKEWVFCQGLKKANDSIWDKMYDMYKYHNEISKYLICSEERRIISNYVEIMCAESRAAKRLQMDDNAEIMQQSRIQIKNFLSILARHVKQFDVNTLIYFVEKFDTISIPKPKEVNTIAALIIILNHVKYDDLITDEIKQVTRNVLKKNKIDQDFGNSKIELCRHYIMVKLDRQNKLVYP